MLDFDHARLRLTAALLKGKVPQDTPLMHECWILTTPVSDSLGFLYHLTQSQAQTDTYTGTHTDTHTHTHTHPPTNTANIVTTSVGHYQFSSYGNQSHKDAWDQGKREKKPEAKTLAGKTCFLCYAYAILQA